MKPANRSDLSWFPERLAMIEALAHPYGECQCGCGEPTALAGRTDNGRLQVRGEPVLYRPGHVTRKSLAEYVEQDCGFDSPCWVWAKSRISTGYGEKLIDGRKVLAHRAYYERHHGPIPDGLVVHHRCENPPCVNPEHLEAVTNAENVRLGRSTLTPDLVRAIKASPLGCVKASRVFGISKSSVLAIRAGRRWVDVT